MINLDKAKPTLKPNYIKMPVTRTDSVDEFNAVLAHYRSLGYNKLDRTESGGISLATLRLPAINMTTNKWGVELIVGDCDGWFRLQFRNNLFDDVDEKKLKITGKQALNKFYYCLQDIGIDLNDYAIPNGKMVKATIEKPLIQLDRQSFKDVIFTNAHHLDINSSYPAGVKEYHPEFGPVIDEWYKRKQAGHKEYKAYLNLMIGTMQSSYIGYKYADISKYAIGRNNQKIREMAQWLKDNGRVVLLYNTDGIWFTGDPYPEEPQSKELGAFKQDHTNCTFRAKSDGAYEFIEDGVYYPVLRGHTKLDEYLPRDKWKWGDIYQDDATMVKKYIVNFEEGIREVYEKLD